MSKSGKVKKKNKFEKRQCVRVPHVETEVRVDHPIQVEMLT